MQLSVVIPCYNNAGVLGEQLESLARQSWEGSWEVVVSDNGSTDGSQALAMSYADRVPGLRVIDASAQRGAAYARNTGVAQAQGDWLAFCDADDVVGEGWVAAVAQALAQHRFVAGRFEFDRLNPPDLHVYRSQDQALDRLTFLPHCLHAGSGNMAVRREWFEKVNGFDTSLRCLEDTDLCIRLYMQGVQLHFAPSVVLHVRRRQSCWGQFRQSARYMAYRAELVARYDPGQAANGRRGLLRQGVKAARLACLGVARPGQRFYYADRLGRLVGEMLGRRRRRGAAS